MNKIEKIEKIEKITYDLIVMKKVSRDHYVSEEKNTTFDPQKIIQKVPWLYSLIKSTISATFPQYNWRKNFPDIKNSIVVNLGAGATNLDPELINVDFVNFSHIDIVTDFSHSLPIRDALVDGVLSISVLEHMENPEQVISEVARILKPGGTLYLATPFQYPFHGAPNDFMRWTVPGLTRLLDESFFIVKSGSRGGPMGVMILSMAHAIAQVLCFGSKQVFSYVNFSVMGLLSPLKLLDFIFSKLPYNTNLCTGIYVIAERKKC